jgi:pSer/pThr/pTyr-binding forkhead associated (FHA) protein
VGKLVLLLADGTTLDVPLAKERMTIGRRADNDICLPHPAVSGEHASVVTILADSFLEDLGSTNGTLVNGKPIVKHFLRDYDQIDIGRQRLVFVSDDNAHVDPLPPDIARNQLLGLNARVEPARPVAAVPSASHLRGAAAKFPPLLYPDLDEEVALHEAIPEVAARKDAAPSRAPIADRHPAPNRHESDQRLAAWAAEWAAPTGKSGAGAIDTSGASAGASRAGAASRTAAPIAPVVPEVPTPPEPTVRVLSGPNHGRAVPFNKEELSVGRVGLQVAVVRKVGTGFRLVPVEGVQPPRINGMPVAPEGTALHPGDTFEVAGVRLELSITS